MLPLIIGGAALGIGQGLLSSNAAKNKLAKELRMKAIETKFSPWTKMAKTPVGEINSPDPLTSALSGGMQGGFSGASLGQNLESFNQQKEFQDALKKYYQSQTPMTKLPVMELPAAQRITPEEMLALQQVPTGWVYG